MSLRIIQAGLGRPVQYPVDPNATFEPGMVGQLKVIGNDIVLGVSDGTAPIGILDDIKSVAFTQPVVDEIVDISVDPVTHDGYNFVSVNSEMKELMNANIVPNSFRADIAGLQLNPTNGVVRAPAGTVVNYTSSGSTPDTIRTTVRYSFYVPGIPGEDTTQGSGKVTFWFTRGVYETDQFEMVPFAVNATLFISPSGKFTTEQTSSNQPGVAMCTVPPTAHNPRLQLLWF